MKSQNPSAGPQGVKPSIHIWMTPEEAAEEMGTLVAEVDRELDQGDLETRVNREGVLQVLVNLNAKPVTDQAPPVEPTLPTVTTLAPLAPEPQPAVSGTLMPLMAPLSWQKTLQLRRAERSARWGWAAAAAMFLMAAGALYLAATPAPAPANNSAQIASQLADVTNTVSALTVERDSLRSQLAQNNATLSKVQSELAVDRNVEDTLLKAALAAKANQSTKSQIVTASTN